jgi:hypothetical protein
MGDRLNTMAYLCLAVIALIAVSAVNSNLDLAHEVSTNVTTEFQLLNAKTNNALKNAVFWDVTPCGSCKIPCFRGKYRLHDQSDKNRQATNFKRVLRVLVTANVVPSSPILVTMMNEAIRSSETSVLARVTVVKPSDLT